MMNIMQSLPSSESVNDHSLAGKAVLVTGGGSGLGAALCRLLAEAGADVVVADIHADKATAQAKTLEHSSGQIHAISLDVGDPEAAEQAVAETIEKFGRLD